MKGCEDVGPWTGRPRAETMLKSEEVEAMLHLHALGWGIEADRQGARVQQEHGAAVRGGGRLDGVPAPIGPAVASSRSRRRGCRSASSDTAAMPR